MDSKTLINELIKRRILNEETGDKILKTGAASRQSVEDIIYNGRMVDETELARVKSQLLKIPYKAVDINSIDDSVLKLIPEETSRNYNVIPLSRDRGLLVVGMVNPDDTSAQNALKYIAKQLGVSLGVYLVRKSDVESVWRRYSPYQSEIAAAFKALNLGSVKGKSASSMDNVVRLDEKASVSEDAPIIKIVASTLKEAVSAGASDIHFEPQRSRARIRFRIDGVLHETASLPIELQQPIISRIKVISNLKIDENRIPQDGRFRTIIFGRDIDFRVSSFPTPLGEKIALRVLDPTVGLKGLAALGLNSKNMRTIKESLARPFGLILLSGPTGSGKTTTIYALLQELNKEEVNIVSLEDPVEYFVESINQSQVRPEIGYDFVSGLRQILRQDPDVIMVGEIRDKETASLVIHAALTGHVVVSTIHTNNASGIIPRLVDMGVEPFLLPSALNLMVAQRLIVKLCESCRSPEVAPPELQKIIKKAIDGIESGLREELAGKFKEPYKIFHAKGCKVCHGKGTLGRIAIFEMFSMTPELENIINKESTEQKILEEGMRQGMVSLRQDGIIKSLEGLVAVEEVIRETTEA